MSDDKVREIVEKVAELYAGYEAELKADPVPDGREIRLSGIVKTARTYVQSCRHEPARCIVEVDLGSDDATLTIRMRATDKGYPVGDLRDEPKCSERERAALKWIMGVATGYS